jgi:hypothetical protein
MKTEGEEVQVEVAQETEEQFVFLEQFPTDKTVVNPVRSTDPTELLFGHKNCFCWLTGNRNVYVSVVLWHCYSINISQKQWTTC